MYKYIVPFQVPDVHHSQCFLFVHHSAGTLVPKVSNLPLQRMFQDACQSTNQLKAEEKLLLENFPLFLLMLANKTHAGQACPVLQDRVVLLFQRINAIACTSTQAPRFGLAKEALLPLSRESTRRTSIQSSMMEEPRRHDEAGLSWDELLSSTF
ncbi:unnamed protein product [Durusdinium trenchii]|uniref:Uncharacterized protein n=1 Tax=Durusdinium trenchii TaxID=1381693 RepID=A0ABP0PCL9_9DINO